MNVALERESIVIRYLSYYSFLDANAPCATLTTQTHCTTISNKKYSPFVCVCIFVCLNLSRIDAVFHSKHSDLCSIHFGALTE